MRIGADMKETIKKIGIVLIYILMIALIMVFFTGHGTFIYEGV